MLLGFPGREWDPHLALPPRRVSAEGPHEPWIFIFQYFVAAWLESISIDAHAVLGYNLRRIAAAGELRSISFPM